MHWTKRDHVAAMVPNNLHDIISRLSGLRLLQNRAERIKTSM